MLVKLLRAGSKITPTSESIDVVFAALPRKGEVIILSDKNDVLFLKETEDYTNRFTVCDVVYHTKGCVPILIVVPIYNHDV